MTEAEHEVTIRCINPDEQSDKRKFVAQCTSRWKATGTGDKGEMRVGRKADAHLHGGMTIFWRP
jgi:hypothetical protein